MVGYKLSKNDWVTPSFVIFRSVREKLLVTVFFDHPVAAESLAAKAETADGTTQLQADFWLHSARIVEP